MIPDFTTYVWPSWAYSDAAKLWLAGFVTAAMIRIFRASLRWFKRAGTEKHD